MNIGIFNLKFYLITYFWFYLYNYYIGAFTPHKTPPYNYIGAFTPYKTPPYPFTRKLPIIVPCINSHLIRLSIEHPCHFITYIHNIRILWKSSSMVLMHSMPSSMTRSLVWSKGTKPFRCNGLYSKRCRNCLRFI